MSYGFTRALLALTALNLVACAEEAADPMFDAGQSAASGSDASSADAGTQADAATTGEFAAFDQALNAAIAAHNKTAPATAQIRGASAVVVDKEDGVVHTQGYGEFDADRLYLIASSSKILSVGVLMRLADQGKLDIDKPIADYLGGSWGAHKSGVTVAQLVSNSSGLPSLPEIIAGATSNPSLVPHLCQYAAAGTLADCGRAIYADDAPGNNRRPDEQFRYGGSQWQLAGAVAEQVSGKKWAELIDETYRQPCDVDSLGYTNQFENSALGYPIDFDGDASAQPVTENPSIEGGAYITAPDYGKLLHMHLRGGTCGDERVLSESAVTRMQENRIAQVFDGDTENEMMPGYGLGWWIHTDGLRSDGGAYGAFPYIDNERGYAAMVIIEVSSEVGAKIALTSKAALDAIFDARD